MNFFPRYRVQARKVGQIIDTIFHLRKQKKAKGFCVVMCEENERRLEKLKKKYGLGKVDVNMMNVVNVFGDDIDYVQSDLFNKQDQL